MRSVAVIGAGQIGAVVAGLLGAFGRLSGDGARPLGGGSRRPGLRAPASSTGRIDVADAAALDRALAGQFAVLSAAPYHLTLACRRGRRRAGAHYLDLTEDVAATRAVARPWPPAPTTAFIPQCGLAPGFISIVAADLALRFDDAARRAPARRARCRSIRPTR